MAGGRKLLFFLIGQVGQDQPINADLRAGRDEPLCAVGEHDICIGHEHHGDRNIFPHLADEVKDLIRGGPRFQGADVGTLNDRALGGGVRERDAQLNEVGTVCRHGADGGGSGFQIRVAAGDERNERLAVGKGLCNVTHEDPPLCSGQWRRSPYRRGRKW